MTVIFDLKPHFLISFLLEILVLQTPLENIYFHWYFSRGSPTILHCSFISPGIFQEEPEVNTSKRLVVGNSSAVVKQQKFVLAGKYKRC